MAENAEMMISLRDVSKKYGKRVLFSGLNGQVRSGECLLITGQNGSGKTTLLKLIARLVRPSTGRIEIYSGQKALANNEECLLYLGLVSPEIILYDNLTGTENITLLAGARGISLSASAAREALGAVGLTRQQQGQYVKTFSTGMKQRLKFALLPALNPPIWLVDEGLANLDETGKRLILTLLGRALQQRRLLVLATNEEREAVYASQAIHLA